jgi:hypothetical protein
MIAPFARLACACLRVVAALAVSCSDCAQGMACMSQLATTIATATPVTSYSQSAAAVRSFVAWMQTTAVPPADPGPFQTAQQHAMQWTNQIFPVSLQLPGSIVSWNPGISQQLTALAQVVAQLQNQSTNSGLLDAVRQNAQALQGTITGYLNQVNTLVKALQAFSQALQGDYTDAAKALVSLQQDLTSNNNQLAALYGQLHRLQNATCPSASDIQKCSAQIASVQGQINNDQPALTVYTSLQEQLPAAIQGLQYLAGYWATLSSDAGSSAVALRRVGSDPAQVLSLDITQATQAWSATVVEAQAIQQTLGALQLV